jgi:ribonucleoside-diphosphate reductase beta chain
MDEMLNGAEHVNFFENRATEYSKASTQGSWEEVFASDIFTGNYQKPDPDDGGDSKKEAA